LDTKDCELSPDEIAKMEELLNPLREPARQFPVSDLYVTVSHYARSGDYHVGSSLVLTGRTLFTGERDENPVSAFGRCVRKLIHRLAAYKDNLAAKPEQVKAEHGTAHAIVPTQEPDAQQVAAAIAENDYAAFREAMVMYEEPIRKRVGRWIQRYPEFEERLGAAYALDDLVEEVLLNAFEQFDEKPQAMRLGEWIEELIDPSVKDMMNHPNREQANIDAVRSWREVRRESASAEHG
jgi:ribosome-associated translation inhibitor RaiA